MGDCFIYNNSSWRLNYCVGSEVSQYFLVISAYDRVGNHAAMLHLLSVTLLLFGSEANHDPTLTLISTETFQAGTVAD